MTFADFSKIKDTSSETFFILPILSLPSQHIKFISCSDFIYIISSRVFPNKQCLSCFHHASIKACPVLPSSIETGTGRQLETAGSKVVSEERHKVTL